MSKSFVPVSDKIERHVVSLEEGTSLESLLVQKIKKQCNDVGSYQGIFVAAPKGLLLSGSHEAIHDARKVEELMLMGIKKWGELSRDERLMPREVFVRAVAELSDEE